MNKWLKNEEGSGLVLAIMTLLVLLVLGLSIGTITISGHRMSHTNRDSISAYYIAEAGANMAYEDMKSIVEEIYDPNLEQGTFFHSIEAKFDKDISKYGSDDFETQFGYQPEANIKIGPPEENDGTRVYTIESVSNIGNHSRTAQKEVRINWIDSKNGNKPPILSDNLVALFTNKLSVDSGTIHGDIYAKSDKNKMIEVSNSGANIFSINNIYIDDLNYKNNLFVEGDNRPYNPSLKQKVALKPTPINLNYYDELISNLLKESSGWKILNKNFDQNGVVNIDQNYRVEKMNIRGNHTFNIGNEEVYLLTDTLKTGWGSVKIEGNGTLNIIVKKEAEITIPFNSNSKKLRIIYLNTTAPLEIKSGMGKLTAQVIAPYSEVHIWGSGHLYGGIIAKDIQIGNMGFLYYKNSGLQNNDITNDVIQEVGLEDLISTEPTKEP